LSAPSWTLVFSQRSRFHQGEKVYSLFSYSLGSAGTLYRSLTEYYDHIQPNLIKDATESMAFVGSGGGGGNTPVPATELFDSVSSVAVGVETTVVTLTVPAGHTAFLSTVQASGDKIGVFKVYVNSAEISQGYISLTSFNIGFTYSAGTVTGVPLNSGDIVKVTITNNSFSPPEPGDYSATIQYVLM
jgi:hypothetical protein